ncbi:phosphoribosylglycinamide formyltransferase [Clostridiales bacterium COT073_COT-073]|nr:phosphoribosylglycinamide formyltransferase [Clostridiales bacterium COT073_COT-073]
MLTKFAVLVSGNGSNLQALIDEVHKKGLGEIVLVLSDKEDAYALSRAEKADIPAFFVDPGEYPNREEYHMTLLRMVVEAKAHFIVLAGYLRILTKPWIDVFPNKIINIHPSLLPKHSGKGYYGLKVHQSVLAAGDKESGATVHFVDEGTDTGPILLQEKVIVDAGETADSLQKKVLKIEHKLIVEAVSQLCRELKPTQAEDEDEIVAMSDILRDIN